MITHIVLFKFREDVTPDQIEAMASALRALPGSIPCIDSLSCGPNFSDRNQGYQYGLTVLFADRDALAKYMSHADHVRVLEEKIKPVITDVLAVDYAS